jgi:hypothetical protein
MIKCDINAKVRKKGRKSVRMEILRNKESEKVNRGRRHRIRGVNMIQGVIQNGSI